MPCYEFSLNIPADEFLRVYRGTVSHVVVRATTGQRVQVPAARFRPFVTAEGVAGRFVLTCDENHKCLDLQRVSHP
jgi:hypothetical protein